jgi:hypothetical protein
MATDWLHGRVSVAHNFLGACYLERTAGNKGHGCSWVGYDQGQLVDWMQVRKRQTLNLIRQKDCNLKNLGGSSCKNMDEYQTLYSSDSLVSLESI